MLSRTLGLLILGTGLSFVIAQDADPKSGASAPQAKKQPHKAEIHGDVRIDEYHWLRNKKSDEVVAHLKAENDYTARMMKHTDGFQEKLYKEMLGRIKQTDLSVPSKSNGYWYYSRTEEGKQYSINCRKKGSLEATEEVLIDGNEEAKGHKFFSVGGLVVSDDNKLMAYVTDVTGFREYHLSVKDLQSGKLLEERKIKTSQIVWSADNSTLFYVTEDDAKRPFQLRRHVVGRPSTEDVTVYEEKDELYRLGIRRSRDRAMLFASSESSNTSEQRFLDAANPKGEWSMIARRREGVEYSAERFGSDRFLIHTNADKAVNFQMMTTDIKDPTAANWKVFRPHDPKVMISGFTLYRDNLVIQERENGLPQLRVIELKSGRDHRVEFPEPVYDVMGGGGTEYDSGSLRFNYTSLLTPSTVFEYGMSDRKRTVLKKTEVLGGYDPAAYATERIWATAKDGTKIPISLVYKKSVKRDGSAPIHLYGYGSYGFALPIGFSSSRLSMLDRGVVYAQAHIRGGDEMGRTWYDDGKLMAKKNTFTDFIACADHLVAEKYGDRKKMVISGGSAGGLLIGAVINMRPDVATAAVLQVPFVDVINTMLDASLPLTVQEYLEWGNPNQRTDYDYMKSYCPYTNIAAKNYPSILVTTSFNDSQVMYWEPAKYVARMRATKTDPQPILFKCNMAGGHGGSSGRYDSLREAAFVTAFMLDRMGIKE